MEEMVIYGFCSEAMQILRGKRQMYKRRKMHIVSVCFFSLLLPMFPVRRAPTLVSTTQSPKDMRKIHLQN